ncbi:MAG TPA: GntG family PLP-dependent aldolase [Candidatus Acidoferrales bacterium]|nr:GntG family PLP-dependent aldolase [Candidatus Acidoferrales bacterium]
MSEQIDLRSDTVTRPTAAMRRAMAEAEVGDDFYGEDPTVNRLEARAAELFAREAGLFVPSGLMGNLLAIWCWTERGQEVICDARSHTYVHEMGAMSAIAGVMPHTIPTSDGILTWDCIAPHVHQPGGYYSPTGLIELESTHNLAGGTIYPPEVIADAAAHTHADGLKVHLDGARIFNAAVALGKSVADITRSVDSVMFCLSKGLGAPVGSVLVGPRDFIAKARLRRRILGGAMRQAGVLAAAGLVALEESPKGLARDHENARFLAEGLVHIPGILLDPAKVVTNIVMFDVEQRATTAAAFAASLRERGVLCAVFGPQTIRMVTHCDVDRAHITRALEIIRTVL